MDQQQEGIDASGHEAGRGSAILLEPSAVVLPGGQAGAPGVQAARTRASIAARARLPWTARAATEPVPLTFPLPQVDELSRVINRAVATGREGVRVIKVAKTGAEIELEDLATTRSWTIGTINLEVPDPLTVGEGLASGGVVLDNGERWSTDLADLADAVAVALAAHVRISVVTGVAPVAALGDGYWEEPAVVALGGSVVVDRLGADAVEIPAGCAQRLESVRSIVVPADGLALVVGMKEPTREDLWQILVNLAGYWPRLRLDVPRDPRLMSRLYGVEEPLSAIDAVRSVLRDELLTPEMAERCLAWWSANILPAPRGAGTPAPDIRGAVRGSLPGGLGFVQDPNKTVPDRGAAGGWVFSLFDASPELLARLVSGEEVLMTDVGDAEKALVSELCMLGLARSVPSED